MKLILLCFIAFFVSASSISSSKTVYLCLSETAVAYHIVRDCKGLDRCTHKIIETTLKDAIEKYNRRSCRFCNN